MRIESKVWVSVIMVSCVALGCARGMKTSAVSTAGWVEVSLRDVGFSARMPGQFELERETIAAEDGAPMTVVSGGVVAPEVIAGFRVIEDRAGFAGHPMNGDTFVDVDALSAQQNGQRGGQAAATIDWTVVNESRVPLEGFQAMERTAVSQAEGIALHTRTVVGRTRVYSVFVAHRADSIEQMAPFVRALFDSVSIDSADAIDPIGDGRLDASTWRYLYPTDTSFAALPPGAAQRSEATLPIAAESYPVIVYTVADETRRYEVITVELGHAATPRELDALSERMGTQGLVERERHDAQLQGFPGRDVTFERDATSMRSRFYATGGRLYELRLTAPTASAEIHSTSAARFFDSFRIL